MNYHYLSLLIITYSSYFATLESANLVVAGEVDAQDAHRSDLIQNKTCQLRI
jgi:hypothetical protein